MSARCRIIRNASACWPSSSADSTTAGPPIHPAPELPLPPPRRSCRALGSFLGLTLDCLGRRFYRRRIPQIAAAARLQALIELVQQGDASRDVELDDRLLRQSVQHLDQRPQTIAVG